MELTHLRYFLEVAKNEHITKSARNLCIVQPALTQAIHKLEAEIGVPLFKNAGRNIKLTEYGQYFYEHLLPLYEEIEKLPQELRNLANKEVTQIKVNIVAASSLVTSAVILYKQKNQSIDFDLIQNETTNLYDVSVYTVADSKAIKNEDDEVFFFEEEIFLAVPNNSHYKKMESISLKELNGEKFIGLAGTKQLRSICNEFCDSIGAHIDVSFESDNTTAIKDAVAAGIGVSFWPLVSWGKVEKRKIKLLKITDAHFKRDIVITLRKDKLDSSHTEHFYKFLVNFFTKACRKYA